MFKFSFFKNVYETTKERDIDLQELIELIKSKKYKGIDKLQRGQISVHATFQSDRGSDDYTINHVVSADFDIFKKDKKQPDCLRLFYKLSADPHCFLTFISPSGLGIKVFAAYKEGKFEDNINKFHNYLIEQYGYQPDVQAKHIKNLCAIPDGDYEFKEDFKYIDRLTNATVSIDKLNLSKAPPTAQSLQKKFSWAEKQATEKVGEYTEGNRNNFIFTLSYLLNYLEIEQDEAKTLILSKNYTGLTVKEIEGAIRSAYKYVINHPENKEDKGKESKEVKEILKKMLEDNNVYILVKKEGWKETFVDLYRKEGIILQQINTDNIISLIKNNIFEIYDKAITKVGQQNYVRGLCEPIDFDNIYKNSLKQIIYPLNTNKYVKITESDIKIYSTKEGENINIVTSKIIPDKIIKEIEKNINERAEIDNIIKNSVYYKFIVSAIFDNQEGDPEHPTLSVDTLMGLMDLLGYLVSGICIKDNSRCVIFTDKESVDSNTGGTGKSLLANSLKYFVPVGTTDGRIFDPYNRFRFQNLVGTEKLIIIEDADKNFVLSTLYPTITDYLTIEKKGANVLQISAEYGYKILITANTLSLDRDVSDLRRRLIVEFSNHYNKNYTPKDEFGIELFRDFADEQWGYYYAFLLHCCFVFLKSKLSRAKEVFSEDLDSKKLSNEFYDFEEYLSGFIPDNVSDFSLPIVSLYDRYKAGSGSRVGIKTFRKKLTEWLKFKGFVIIEENARIYIDNEYKRAIKIKKMEV